MIVTIVVVVLLLVGGAYFVMNKSHMNSSQAGQTANPQSQSQSQQMITGKKSLADFFSMKGTLKCTFSNKTDNSGTGTVYIGAGKMRGDFQSAAKGTTAQTHMINDGTYVYIWTEGQKNGYKMSLDAVKGTATQMKGNGTSSTTKPQGMDMNQQSNYSCGPWVVNGSAFKVPADITFVDYSTMMQGGTSGTSTHQGAASKAGSSEVCSRCNTLPSAKAQQQCKAILKC